MELNRLLLLTAFLLHMKPASMIPIRLVCDRRLIQKYILEAVSMENRVGQCEALPLLKEPVYLPRVGFVLKEWKMKENQVKGLEVLHDLGQLVNATTATQRELRQECAFALLQLLYEKASALIRQLQNFGWQGQDFSGQSEDASRLIPERTLRTIFQTYSLLVKGKLSFLFYELRKDSCSDSHRPVKPDQNPSNTTISREQ